MTASRAFTWVSVTHDYRDAMPWLPVLAILVPTSAIAAAFFVAASRREGLDRRKNMVGGILMSICGLTAAAAAGLLSTVPPPG